MSLIDATYISSTSFSVVGDQTDIFSAGRKIRADLDGSYVYGTVVSSVFDTVTTVVITETVLTADLTGVNYAIVSNQSLPNHEHDDDYEAKNSNIQSHISSTTNPHTVTSTQVLPSQTGNTGKVLETDGTSASWQTPDADYIKGVQVFVSNPLDNEVLKINSGAFECLPNDKLAEGNSSVEVVDTGNGYVDITIDGSEIVTVDTTGINVNKDLDITSSSIYFTCKSEGNAFPFFSAQSYSSHSATRAPTFEWLRTRGTYTAQTTVADGDTIGVFQARTFDGTNSQWNTMISVKVDGTVSTNTVPQKICFETSATNTAGKAERFVIQPNGDCRPGSDNALDLGTSSYRWDDIYATNGTIQTSDVTTKDTILDIDLGLSFICDLRPVSFKWKDYTVSGTRTYIEEDEKGEIVDKTINYVEEHKHKRIHQGLIASEVKGSLDKISKSTNDFAGYIKNKETNLEGLRYSEFIAPMIKAIQELKDKNDALEARIAILEAKCL